MRRLRTIVRPGRIDRRLLVSLVFVALVTVGLRLPGAIGSPLWQDEVASARVLVQPSLGSMLAQVRKTESAPPAWYAVGWVAHEAGLSVQAFRFFSVLLSAALAVLVVLAALRLMPLPAATLAGLLVAVGWQFLIHGYELRAYSLLAALALGFALLLERAAAVPSRGRLAALGALVALGVLTHYFFALTVIAGVVWLWSERRPGGARVRVSAAVALGAAAFLPWLPSFLEQYHQGRFEWIAAFDPLRATFVFSGLFSDVGSLYARAAEMSPGPAAVGVSVAVLAAVLGGFGALARRSSAGRLLALCGLLPVAGAALVWLAGPRIFDVRNLIGVGPFAAIALAAACAAIPRPLAVAAAGGVLAFAAAGVVERGVSPTPAYDQVAEALVDQGWRPGDPVVLLGRPTRSARRSAGTSPATFRRHGSTSAPATRRASTSSPSAGAESGGTTIDASLPARATSTPSSSRESHPVGRLTGSSGWDLAHGSGRSTAVLPELHSRRGSTRRRPAPLHRRREADRLLVEEQLALLIGFALDQQVPLQRAFSAPLRRFGGVVRRNDGADTRWRCL